MKRFLKITATVVAVVLVVAIVTPLLLRGKIGDIVKREANAMLAARLDFEKLDISLLRNFPNASLNLKGLTLVGTDRFEGDTIVAARRITVVVNLMSLVGDEGFEVRKIILASPALHAHKLADGAVNWDVMKPSEPADTTAAEESAPSSFRLSVRDFRLTDAVIRYEDDSTGMELRTAPLSLRLSGDMSPKAHSSISTCWPGALTSRRAGCRCCTTPNWPSMPRSMPIWPRGASPSRATRCG